LKPYETFLAQQVAGLRESWLEQQELVLELKGLCARAADALEVFKYDVDWILQKQKLIAELRKRAK
jgi:hypothetical protein